MSNSLIRTGLFRYVRLAEVQAYEARGWLVAGPINVWSVLMWHCDCGRVQP